MPVENAKPNASNLEQLLYDLTRQADGSSADRAEMATRFDYLRRFGRLPRGRENRAARLSNHHIGYAILGLGAHRAAWAGQVAIGLGNLKPVGGPTASVEGATSLLDAIALLLADERLRQNLISIAFSSAESGTNAHGTAVIKLRTPQGDQTISFVPATALSLFQRGAELTYDREGQFAPVARVLTLYRKFFNTVALSVRLRIGFAHQRGRDSHFLCGHVRRGAGWPRLSGARSAIRVT